MRSGRRDRPLWKLAGPFDDGRLAPLGGGSSRPDRHLRLFPNPFRAEVDLDVTRLSPGGPLLVSVHDAGGRRVRTLFDGVVSSTDRSLHWDGRDDAGRRAAPGTYFVRLRTRNGTETRKVTLIR